MEIIRISADQPGLNGAASTFYPDEGSFFQAILNQAIYAALIKGHTWMAIL